MKNVDKRVASTKVFFDDLSAKLNYLDPGTVRDVYYALIRLILLDLRTKGVVKLPDFGSFKTVEFKPRRILNVNTKKHETVASFLALKFEACMRLREYVKNIVKKQ